MDDDLVEFAHRMFDLARSGADDELFGYVDAGLSVQLTDAAGNSLLMLAAYHGNASTVRGLAERGADVDAVNDRGQTPLAGAIFKAEDDVVEALLAAGADPTRGTPSAVETARFFDKQALLAKLLDR